MLIHPERGVYVTGMRLRSNASNDDLDIDDDDDASAGDCGEGRNGSDRTLTGRRISRMMDMHPEMDRLHKKHRAECDALRKMIEDSATEKAKRYAAQAECDSYRTLVPQTDLDRQTVFGGETVSKNSFDDLNSLCVNLKECVECGK